MRKSFSGLDLGARGKIFLISVLFILLFIIIKTGPVLSWGPGNNYRNYSVRTTVDVTNAYPEVLNVSCNNGAAITLNAGTTKTINCTVQIRDYNGGGDINYVNATFYYFLNASSDPLDNNTNYMNASCTNITADGYYTNWSCSFDAWYYALNGTWRANVTANDTYGAKDNDYGNFSIASLLALNATPVIDFGSMAVTDTSVTSVQANITNLGNRPINVSVYGFGGDSEATGANLAMLCQIRNISLPNERYSTDSGAVYAAMTPITAAPVTIPDLTVAKQTLADTYIVNSTYWTLHVNLTTNPFGECNGTVVFSAISP
jgi:hypothetical protein